MFDCNYQSHLLKDKTPIPPTLLSSFSTQLSKIDLHPHIKDKLSLSNQLHIFVFVSNLNKAQPLKDKLTSLRLLLNIVKEVCCERSEQALRRS